MFSFLVNIGDFSVKDPVISLVNGKEPVLNDTDLQYYFLNWVDTVDILSFVLLWIGISILFSYIGKYIGRKKFWFLIFFPYL